MDLHDLAIAQKERTPCTLVSCFACYAKRRGGWKTSSGVTLAGMRVSTVKIGRLAMIGASIGIRGACVTMVWDVHGHNGPGGQLCGSQLAGHPAPQSAHSESWSQLAAATSDDRPLHVTISSAIVRARSSRGRSVSRGCT